MTKADRLWDAFQRHVLSCAACRADKDTAGHRLPMCAEGIRLMNRWGKQDSLEASGDNGFDDPRVGITWNDHTDYRRGQL